MSDSEFQDHSSRDHEVSKAAKGTVEVDRAQNGLLEDIVTKEDAAGVGEGGGTSAPAATSAAPTTAPTTALSITYPSPLLAAILNFGLLLALFLVALDMVSLPN